ncbi:MAG: alpha-L-fucosidase [Sedimentisphaerales bacterium]|nr:alpha-L-fucosidase [Sedimentisphaerales bacterium]
MKQGTMKASWIGSAVLLSACLAAAGPYQAQWESLDKRPTPSWFQDAKFGIFIHWGVYSVPAWGEKTKYAEWYWNSLHTQGSPTEQFHNRVYGSDFPYFQFADRFEPHLFDPEQWADLFVRSGARYVVLTSKHHDGYCLWPSKEANTSWGRPWNAVDTAPRRDLLGELTTAVHKRPHLKMGFYYSLYEWYNPLYRQDVAKYVDQHMLPQMYELINTYKPSLFWTDGEWDHPSGTWKSEQFLAWLYNESPVKDVVAVNDRWGSECRHVHGGYYTTEYGSGVEGGHPWEECRGMGHSFGYNRNETIDEYRSAKTLIHTLVELVSKGGCLLLDIGPAGDGRIPVIMQQRLIEIGDWLTVNGEAIYETRPWKIRGVEKTFVVERIDPKIDFDWHRGSPDERIAGDFFTAEWTGWIQPRYSQDYTFELTADTRGGLWIDNKLIIDDLQEYRQWGGTGTATLAMEAGKKVPIKVRLVEEDRNANVRLSWSSAGQNKEIVPTDCLFTDRNAAKGVGLKAVYSSQGNVACYTCKGDVVYAISLGWPQDDCFVVDVTAPASPTAATKVELLGTEGTRPWSYRDGKVCIDISDITIDDLHCKHAFAFKLTGFGQ